MILRTLIFIHRWVGTALCVLFLLWFPSGIGMMYWGMLAISARDRLERAPVLDPARVVLSPQEAAARVGVRTAPTDIRLNSFDGRPVYRFGAGGRGAGGGRIVYADTGEEQTDAPLLMRNRAAAAWAGQAASAAAVESITETDQWMVGNQLRTLRPLWKYSWSNGEQLYIGESGEVLLYTTPTTRLQAYLSAIPHWLYFTPLRKNQPVWIRFATYAAMIGTAGALIGVIVGAWLYSPRQKYRYAGAPSRFPYRGQKRWHTILGLVFGIATVTWTLSGSLAFLPFPSAQRTPAAGAQAAAPRPRPTGNVPRSQPRESAQEQGLAPPGQQVQAQAGRPGQAPGRSQAQSPGQAQSEGQGQGGRRGGGGGGLAAALRGRIGMDDIAVHPRELLARHADLGVKELSFTSIDGQPLYTLGLGDGSSRTFTLDGRESQGLSNERVIELVKRNVPDHDALELRTVEQYDYYYQDRTRQRALPVLLALTHDADGTRHYIDPKSALVSTYSDRNWARRFFYSGLHSLNFPWLYNHRPLWDIVVITFMVGGTALCVTALVLAWRVIGKRLTRARTRNLSPQPLTPAA
jgi:hypothetical protein